MMMMGGTVEELMMMLQFWEVLNFQWPNCLVLIVQEFTIENLRKTGINHDGIGLKWPTPGPKPTIDTSNTPQTPKEH